jgi:type I restriction enzyme, S subunit
MSSTSRYSISERGKTPQGWDIVTLGDLISLEYGVGLPRSKRLVGKYPVYGSNGIIGYHNEALINGPGIVIGIKGSIGKVCWVESDFWPIDTTYSVLLQRKDVSMRWLFYKLKQMNLSLLNAATGVPGLNRGDAYALRVALPPLEEQQKIAFILSIVDEKIISERKEKKALTGLKKGLSNDLLIGKVRVTVT